MRRFLPFTSLTARRTYLLVVTVLLGLSSSGVAQQVPTPESVLGFVPGTDRKLVEWPVLVRYYQQLAAASPKVEYRELGKTTLGAPFVALVISSEANMVRLDQIRAANAKLADPRTLASSAERDSIIRNGKTIVLITSSIHSTEVGGHLSPTIIAYRLATENTPAIREILNNTVLLLVPSLNPDGVTIVSKWYNQSLGTPAEGAGPPELYHWYVGHDNNRDWYAFTQVETQLTVDSLHNVWHPQIVHDIHQQGTNGSRLFLPPFLDPVEPNVDPLLVQGFNTLGTFMAWELTGQGKQGIVTYGIYDGWTPARAYQHHHAGVRVLSETASARLATPIDVPFDQLTPGRGFDARVSSVNFADPWPGGHWTLANIVDYQSSGALALLEHAARNHTTWLSNFYTISQRAVDGWDAWPRAFVIPADQENQIGLRTMLGILHRGQVEIKRAEQAFTAAGTSFPSGSYVIELQQPYASFAKALLERQDYPDLRLYPGGPPRPPYDVTAHTLPLLMGVDVFTVTDDLNARLSAPIDPPQPVFDYAGLSDPNADPARARIGLYKSYTASMDEGWTRWIFDTWHVPYATLVDSVIRAGNLNEHFDAIVIPDMSQRQIVQGLPASYPRPYAGGLGTAGVQSLRRFVENGGTLVTFNDASLFAIETFQFPIRDAVGDMDSREFYAPGTLFALELDGSNPLTRGMPSSTAAWFQQSPAFDVTPRTDLRVVARYPSDPDAVLLSGWVLHPERVAGKAALVEADYGRGKVVMFGFRPQYRGQSIATYPLVFNALTGRLGS
jgi:Zinc carboxypeptidase